MYVALDRDKDVESHLSHRLVIADTGCSCMLVVRVRVRVSG